MLQHETGNCICHVLYFWFCVFMCLHCSGPADQWMWAVSAARGLLTARLLSQQGLAVQPACMSLSRDKAASLCVPDCVYSAVCVQSPVGMGHLYRL